MKADQRGIRPMHHRIVGTAEGITNALRTADRHGRLVSVSVPRPSGHGRYAVTAVLLDPPAQNRSTVRIGRCASRKTLLISCALLVALSAFAVVILLALRWLLTHLSTVVGCVALLLVLLAVLRRRTGACLGLHCAGCGHR